MRLFVAIEAPEAWREAATDTLHALPQDVRVLLRPVEPEMMHLTLRFLGDVADAEISALVAALERRVPPVEVRLTLGQPGTFGPATRTGTVMLRIEGDRPALDALVARVDEAVEEALGWPREEAGYQPHVTLGRLGRRATAAERRSVAAAVRVLAPPPPREFTARRVVLMRSHLGPGGARYEVIAAFE